MKGNGKKLDVAYLSLSLHSQHFLRFFGLGFFLSLTPELSSPELNVKTPSSYSFESGQRIKLFYVCAYCCGYDYY